MKSTFFQFTPTALTGVLLLLAAAPTAQAGDFIVVPSWEVKLPDLRCTPVRYADTAPGEYIVRVTNQGNAISRDTWLDVFASDGHRNVAFGDVGYDYVRLKQLPPGATVEYHFYFPEDVVASVIDDDYPMVHTNCLVDTFEQLTEWNEANNHYGSYRQILPSEHQDWVDFYGL